MNNYLNIFVFVIVFLPSLFCLNPYYSADIFILLSTLLYDKKVVFVNKILRIRGYVSLAQLLLSLFFFFRFLGYIV